MKSARRFRHISLITLGIFLLLIIVAAFAIPYYADRSSFDALTVVDHGWFYEDGTPAILSDLKFTNNQTVIHREIDSDKLIGADLCFISTNLNFDCYVDDVLIYKYEPDLLPIYGMSYGNDYHIVNIPGFDGTKTLTIEITDLSNGEMWAGFRNAVFQNGATYYLQTYVKRLGKFTLAFISFLIGLLLFSMGAAFRSANPNKSETISLGVLSMILSLWINTNTYSMELLTRNPGIVRVINYFMLILLPAPAVVFAACLLMNKHSKLIQPVTILTAINAILHIVLITFGGFDYHDLLIISHIMLGIGMLVILILFIQAIVHGKIKEHKRWVMLIAFGILILTGIADMIFFYIDRTADNSRFSRFGLLFFVSVLGVYEIRQLIRMNKKIRESETLEQLAHVDALTGIENRLAFHEYEQAISKEMSRLYAFVQLDINNLKYVNDNFGHAAGDEFICAAADAMNKSFGRYGRLFRTGGDEFIAIVDITETADLYQVCENEFLRLVQIYNREKNPPIPLMVAYGMAKYSSAMDELGEIEQIADSRMYQLKQAQKKRQELP